MTCNNTIPIPFRPIDGHLQDVSALASYLNQFSRHRFIDAASDFHFLIYIATMDMLPLMVISSLYIFVAVYPC